MEKLNVCTLFSGYDSQCMALDRLREIYPDFDYELVAWAEIDKFAITAHNAVYPQWSERNYGDVSKIDWSQVPDFDLLTYSSPCQDFSNAGKQAGGAEGSGTRSSLLWEVRRAILEKRPKYLLMENVAALVSQKFIGTFNQWQLELERYGYTNFSQVCNAKDYGVPQNRERIFMVSILNCDTPYYFPKPFPLAKRLKDVLEENVEERYYLKEDALQGFKMHDKSSEGAIKVVGELQADNRWGGKCIRQQNFVIGTEGCSMSITAKHLMHEFKIAIPSNTKDGVIECENGGVVDISYPSSTTRRGRVQEGGTVAPTLTCGCESSLAKIDIDPIVLGWSRSTDDEGKEVIKRYPVKVANCVTAGKRDNTQNYVVEPMIGAMRGRNTDNPSERGRSNGKYQQRFELNENGTSNTLTGVQKDNIVLEPTYRIRKLTERECFRLMGVTDENSDKIRAVVSKSQCYKMAGNSIVVDNLLYIFEQLLIGNKNHFQQLELF